MYALVKRIDLTERLGHAALQSDRYGHPFAIDKGYGYSTGVIDEDDLSGQPTGGTFAAKQFGKSSRVPVPTVEV
jgi:hypothetical protein